MDPDPGKLNNTGIFFNAKFKDALLVSTEASLGA
jgi:hypothetical protein